MTYYCNSLSLSLSLKKNRYIHTEGLMPPLRALPQDVYSGIRPRASLGVCGPARDM